MPDTGTSSPAISVLMPVYNGSRFLPAALASVLSQTFGDFELIAIDDGSTDESSRILQELAARDSRIHLVRQDNQGIVASLNRALSLARAPLVARMDGDDISRPGRFAKQVAYLTHHPEIAVISGAMDVIDENDVYLRTDAFPTLPESVASELAYRSCVSHPAAMARTAILRSVGGYRPNAQYAEDYDLWLRIAEIGKIANLPDVLLSYRLHAIKISTRHYIEQELAVLAVRGAARLRRRGEPDPLESPDARLALGYRSLQRMFADAVPRAEFGFSFFSTVLRKAAELGSTAQWAKLYLRHGLWDIDGNGAAMMMLLLGHIMMQRRRSGSALATLIPYPFWALVTAVRHPTIALRIAFNARQWREIARSRLLQPGAASV